MRRGKMPKGEPYSDEFKKDCIEKAIKNREENKVPYYKTADDLGLNSGLLCRWIRAYNAENPEPEEVPAELVEEVQEEFNRDVADNGRLRISHAYQRETVSKCLVASGYIVWQTTENGDYFINYQTQDLK